MLESPRKLGTASLSEVAQLADLRIPDKVGAESPSKLASRVFSSYHKKRIEMMGYDELLL